jgi:lysylphosphatidylglycerol synthetase-like protein (DUF2156 family)
MEQNFSDQQNPKAGQSMGIAALVLGILGAVVSFIPCFGLFALLFGVLAIIFGAVGFNQAKKGGAKTSLPIAGLVLGIIACVITVIWVVVVGTKVAENSDVFKDAFEKARIESEKAKDSIDSLEVKMDTIK